MRDYPSSPRDHPPPHDAQGLRNLNLRIERPDDPPSPPIDYDAPLAPTSSRPPRPATAPKPTEAPPNEPADGDTDRSSAPIGELSTPPTARPPTTLDHATVTSPKKIDAETARAPEPSRPPAEAVDALNASAGPDTLRDDVSDAPDRTAAVPGAGPDRAPSSWFGAVAAPDSRSAAEAVGGDLAEKPDSRRLVVRVPDDAPATSPDEINAEIGPQAEPPGARDKTIDTPDNTGDIHRGKVPDRATEVPDRAAVKVPDRAAVEVADRAVEVPDRAAVEVADRAVEVPDRAAVEVTDRAAVERRGGADAVRMPGAAVIRSDTVKEHRELAEQALLDVRAGVVSVPGDVQRLWYRVRRLKVVRDDDGLVERLDGAEPADMLAAVAGVLLDVAGDERCAEREDQAAWLADLREVVGLLERHGAPQVMVAPPADGVVGRPLARHALSVVEIRDSLAVAVGSRNTVAVLHECRVEHPVVEVAELLDLAPDGPTFAWSGWGYESLAGASGTVTSSPAVNIWNCAGVSVGDGNRINLKYEHHMARCPANLGVLLRDTRLRELLAVCLAGGPEAEAARRLLPDLVAQVVAGLDPDQFLPRDEVVARAAREQGLSVRTHGRRLTITHGAGVVVGYAPAVEVGTALTSGAVLVR